MPEHNSIHPTAIVGPDVTLGGGNVIAPFAVVLGPCKIGDRNWIGPHVAVGTPAQIRGGPHPASWDAPSGGNGISIGNDNVIREYVTIHQPTEGTTRIGNDCYLMSYAHVPHDARIGDRVTLSNSTQIGGHTVIGDGANIGLGVAIHQRLAIGSGAMIGMGSVVTRAIPPYAVAYGSPARIAGANIVGLTRAGYGDDVVARLVSHYSSTGEGAPELDLPTGLLAAFAEHKAAVEATRPSAT